MSSSVCTDSNWRRWDQHGTTTNEVHGIRWLLPLAVAATGGKRTDAGAAAHSQTSDHAAIRSNRSIRFLRPTERTPAIQSGQPVAVRFAVKPTSSILTPRVMIDATGEEIDLVTKGRHDPCVGIRTVPAGEAMMVCVLAEQLLLDRGVKGLLGFSSSQPKMN